MGNQMKTLLFLVVVLCFSACSTAPKYSLLKMKEPTTDWFQGHAYQTFSKDGLRLTAGIRTNNRYNLTFQVALINDSDSLVIVDPQDFYYYPVVMASMTDKAGQKIRAIDPKEQVARLDERTRQLHNKEARNHLFGFLDGVFSLVNTFSGNATDEDDKDQHIRRLERTVELQEIAAEKQSVRRSVDYWENNILQRNTVYPGEKLIGLVRFPQPKHGVEFRFCFPINDNDFSIVYKRDYYGKKGRAKSR
jgi:hypothetical protein